MTRAGSGLHFSVWRQSSHGVHRLCAFCRLWRMRQLLTWASWKSHELLWADGMSTICDKVVSSPVWWTLWWVDWCRVHVDLVMLLVTSVGSCTEEVERAEASVCQWCIVHCKTCLALYKGRHALHTLFQSQKGQLQLLISSTTRQMQKAWGVCRGCM